MVQLVDKFVQDLDIYLFYGKEIVHITRSGTPRPRVWCNYAGFLCVGFF